MTARLEGVSEPRSNSIELIVQAPFERLTVNAVVKWLT
jgi:hypothetical protein